MRFLILACSLLPAVAQTQAPQVQPAFDFRQVDAILSSAISSFSRGMSLTVAVDGRIVFRRAYGDFASDRAVPIASATKWYSAAVILSLVDQGLLDLDGTVSAHISSFGHGKSSIKLRQLLSHTSGLVGDVPCLYEAGTTLALCVENIAGEPLRFPPGTGFAYGNASMQVAARMAELAARKPWNQLFHERLVEPLGMTCTSMNGYGTLANPVVANGARSCESDYLKFLEMILQQGVYQGRTILSRAAVGEMMRDQTAGVPILYSIYTNYAALEPDLPRLRYGLGAWRERVTQPGNQALELGSQGATGFSPWIDRERNLVAVLSTESSQDAIMSAYLQIKAAIRAAVPSWDERVIRVTNGASFTVGPLVPGALVSIFGPGIGPSRPMPAQMEGPVRIASRLDNVRVLFDGLPAPLLYGDWDQISAVAPFAIGSRMQSLIQIERDGDIGPAITLPVAQAAPGVFLRDAASAVAMNQDGSLNSIDNPAPRGSIIVFYATGGGQTNPPWADGQIQTTISNLIAPAQVTVGGAEAEILYAGGAPGLVAGVLQFNVRLAESTPAGDRVRLVLTIAGLSGPPVLVSVR